MENAGAKIITEFEKDKQKEISAFPSPRKYALSRELYIDWSLEKITALQDRNKKLVECLRGIDINEWGELRYPKVNGKSISFWEIKDKLLKQEGQ